MRKNLSVLRRSHQRLVEKGYGEVGIALLKVENADVVKTLHIVRMSGQDRHIGFLRPGEISLGVKDLRLPELLVSTLCGQVDHGVGASGLIKG